MGLTLVTGRATSGKTKEIHDRAVRAAHDGRPAILLLPTYHDARRVEKELAERVPVGVACATIDSWFEGLWAREGDGRTLVPSSVRLALIAQELEAKASRGELPGSQGMLRVLARLAARSGGLTPKQPSAQVFAQVGDLLERYRRACERSGFIERGEALRRIGRGSELRDAFVGVNRFTDLSPAQTDFLVGISKANEVAIALTWEKDKPSTAALDGLVARLEEVCEQHIRMQDSRRETELEQVEDDLFAPRGPVRPRGEVRLTEATSAEAEIALTAREVSKLLDEGFEADRIAVVFRDVARRASALTAAFAVRGIPSAIDVALPLRATALGRAITALTAVVDGEGGRGRLLAFLLGPYSGVSVEDVERLDVAWRRRRTASPAALLAEVAQVNREAALTIRTAEAAVNAMSGDDLVTTWQALCDRLIETRVQRAGSLTADAALREDAAVRRVLVRAAGDLSNVGLPGGGGQRLRALATELSVTVTGEEPSGCVQVTEAHRLRGRRFDALIIGGLSASEFSPSGPEPLIARICDRLGLPVGMPEDLSERLLFYSLVTRARARLVLIRQAADQRGEPLRPSAFWDEVLDVYRTAEQSAAGEPGSVRPEPGLTLEQIEQSAPYFSPSRVEKRAAARSGVRRPPRLTRGTLSPEAKPVDEDHEFSITEIETYRICPYRWFFERVVRPREVDIEFGARERGSYAHRLVSRFYTSWREGGRARVTPGVLPAALSHLSEVIAAVTDEMGEPASGLSETLSVKRAHTWVRGVIERDANLFEGYEPIEHEWRFGRDVGRAVEIEGVAVRGSVDRLDRSGSKLIVTDYKSSSDVGGGEGLVAHGHLQVPLYALIAARSLELDIVGGLYRSLSTGIMRGFWDSTAETPEDGLRKSDVFSDEQGPKQIMDEATEAVVLAAQGMRRGDIEPRPLNGGACRFCLVRTTCPGASR